jgi:predicted membrane chloride channel (bestrophin family)
MIGPDDAFGRADRTPGRHRPTPTTHGREVPVVALVVMLFPPLLIAFLLVMERVEEPLRRSPSSREVQEFLGTASVGEVETLNKSGIRRALGRWRQRRRRGRSVNPPLV